MLNIPYNKDTYRKAVETEGFFSEREAELLMQAVSSMCSSAVMLEFGSYFGRSTLFALAAMKDEQQWLCVDNFHGAAKYKDHTYWKLQSRVADPRVRILPMTVMQAFPHLLGKEFDLVLVDGDHSFLGAAIDLAVGVTLAKAGGSLLCHDVFPYFPGVVTATEALVRVGVLQEVERLETLVHYVIHSQPSWLTDPAIPRRQRDRRSP